MDTFTSQQKKSHGFQENVNKQGTYTYCRAKFLCPSGPLREGKTQKTGILMSETGKSEEK